MIICKSRPFLISILLALVSMAQATTGRAQEVDQSPMELTIARAFPQLRLRRPVEITNAGDGSGRIFVCTQQGVIQVMGTDQSIAPSEVDIFLDIEDQVEYKDNENEEGLLGLAFHPDFAENGEFFVYYTTTDTDLTSVVSRFHVFDDDPSRADPDSEEEIMRIAQPYWNHNGGTLLFGPEGYLYIALGDGGKGKDPHGNGQNLGTLLGSILRIDIDHKDPGLEYAIPRDNPFVERREARPEIWAYGFRNVWRMSFDPATDLLWAADVGQDLYEEIDIVRRGGNYGWNLREAMHPFGEDGSGPSDELIDPIWEYDREHGKSITGGHVYRGSRLPELQGAYLYADYVSGDLWALWFDIESGRVTANRPILDNDMPIVTFGRDESGEIYFSDSFGQIWWLERNEEGEGRSE